MFATTSSFLGTLTLALSCGFALAVSEPRAVPAGKKASSHARASINWIAGSLKEVYKPAGDFYCYAPSALTDGRAERYWCCRNATAGIIRDHIYYLERNEAKLTVCKPVLKPAKAGAWDCFHVCDPSVVAGEFNFHGVPYKYALLYLGNNVDASANNQVGVAFANTLNGEWVRCPEPLIAYPPKGLWGVGQPSAVNLNGRDRLLVFYTRGEAGAQGCFREVDFSNPMPTVGPEQQLPVAGLVNANGGPDYVNNFDVVYDTARERFLAVREWHPYPVTRPDIISTSLELVSISAKDIRSARGQWKREAIISPELTGHLRNHNAGFERTLRGTLPDPTEIRVVFTVSCAETNCVGRDPLWTYGLWEIRGRIRQASSY